MRNDSCNEKDDGMASSSSSSSYSLNESFGNAKNLIENGGSGGKDIEKGIGILQDLQQRIACVGMFSKNEELEDLSTSSLELLSIEFHLGLAYSSSSSTTRSAKERKDNLIRSMDYHHSYLRRLEEMQILKDQPEIIKNYHQILDMEEQQQQQTNHNNHTQSSSGQQSTLMLTQGQMREIKIARFRLKKNFTDETKRLASFRERRNRMNLSDEEMLDGYDTDTLQRTLLIVELTTNALASLEEIESSTREMTMLEMAVQMEQMRNIETKYKGTNNHNHNNTTNPHSYNQPPRNVNNKPLELTHVTQDAQTGQLIFKKEQIRSQVFRPGWNQPTMSLAELGDRERAEAIERENRQKQAEQDAKLNPRRYEQLLKDGLEDNADLVDASAKLDRDWDNWKEENPRGSGNKKADRGDRNF